MSNCVLAEPKQAGFAEAGVSRDLHVGQEVAILGISLYVLGLGNSFTALCIFQIVLNLPSGIGPLLIGPLSEVHGRNPIYRTSYLLFFALSFPVAFSPHIGESSEQSSMKW